MTTRIEPDVTGMFDTALNAFGDTMKAGVKAQEEMLKFFSGNLNGNSPLGEWQKRSRQMIEQAAPAVQRSAEEWLKLIEQNYRRSVDLLKKTLDAEAGESVSDMQARGQKVWQAMLEMVRENTQAMAAANIRMVELWADILRKNAEQAEAAAKSVK